MINHYVFRAIENCGSEKKLADLLGVKSPTIQQWKTGKRPVPVKKCVVIEKVTNQVVTRKNLRSDWLEIWPELEEK